VSWYDERNTTNVDPTTNQPTLQRFGRASRDDGLTWTADTPISDVIFPIPRQPDPNVQPTYVGNWEVAAFSDNGRGNVAYHTWTDGRVFINGAPQQDVFIKRIAFAPSLMFARSRLTHGAAGTFSVDLPLTGRGVEPRLGGGTGAARNYTIVLGFDQAVNSGTASITGTGAVSGVSFSGSEMIVQLTGVTDVQTIMLTAQNVGASGGAVLPSVRVQIGFLAGDTNGDSTVNSGDAIQTRSRSGQTADATNFRSDVNVDTTINGGDTILVRSRSGNTLSSADPKH
jgi:hypothetical protein